MLHYDRLFSCHIVTYLVPFSTSMLRIILVASFLIGSACAMHLEYLKVDIKEHLDGIMVSDTSNDSGHHDDDLLMTEKQYPLCWACKWVMKKVKQHLGNRENADQIKEKLKRGCEKIRLLTNICIKMIDKHIDILVEELSTDDDPQTICANAGICKNVGMLELIQAFPGNNQLL